MTVCLNGIVRDEAAVIARGLESVRDHIDSWVLVDTGSKDGTQDIIREVMKSVPGVLHERPWVNQQHNRNEALQLARDYGCDYTLTLDADELFCQDEDFCWPDLSFDQHDLMITMPNSGLQWAHPRLLSTKRPWEWKGEADPFMFVDSPTIAPVPIEGVTIVGSSGGSSYQDPDKWHKKAARLEGLVEREPDRPRWRYYVAQAYKDAGRLEDSLAAYLVRARDFEGWAEEKWSAQYEAAKLMDRLKRPTAEVREGYLAAWRMRPTRAEPLYCLGRFLRLKKHHQEALEYLRQAAAIPRPPDRLFIESHVYGWRIFDELALCEFQSRQYKKALETIKRITSIPEGERARIKKNTQAFERCLP